VPWRHLCHPHQNSAPLGNPEIRSIDPDPYPSRRLRNLRDHSRNGPHPNWRTWRDHDSIRCRHEMHRHLRWCLANRYRRTDPWRLLHCESGRCPTRPLVSGPTTRARYLNDRPRIGPCRSPRNAADRSPSGPCHSSRLCCRRDLNGLAPRIPLVLVVGSYVDSALQAPGRDWGRPQLELRTAPI
jgi:hypothetical protein